MFVYCLHVKLCVFINMTEFYISDNKLTTGSGFVGGMNVTNYSFKSTNEAGLTERITTTVVQGTCLSSKCNTN